MKPRTIGLVLVATLALAPGCTRQQRASAETSVAEALISEKEEIQIGEQIKQELDKQGVRYVQDPVVVRYVGGVSEDVYSDVKKDYPGTLHTHVIEAPDEVNAFSTPGGHIYMFSGALTAMESEAELAGVLAHEAGHVVARHAARQLVAAYGVQSLAQLALGEDPGLAQKIAATIVGQGFLAAHSREEEHEADEIGLRLTSRAGYDPQGLVSFLGTTLRGGSEAPKVLAWLSTHPTTASRIEDARAFIEKHHLEGGRIGREAHQDAVRSLRGGVSGS